MEKIDYAITGAVAASYYGIPRTTLDADFVIHISQRHIARFLRNLAVVDVKADLKEARRQLKSGYNIITVSDRLSPHTADLILSPRPITKKRGTVQGVRAYFQSPESLVLAKLRMINATVPRERSQKDRDDIIAILANTRINKSKIVRGARRDMTLDLVRELIPEKSKRKPIATNLAKKKEES